MKQFLESILPQAWVDAYKMYKNKHSASRVRQEWENAGRPAPPTHIIKQQAIQYYQKRSAYLILVETGSYKDDMMLAQKDYSQKLYSIELSEVLFAKAQKKFHRLPHITLLQRNSGDVIAKVGSELKVPAIFCLDGHYSGGVTAKIGKYSPIIEEPQTFAVNNKFQYIILVDDARDFVGEHGYPTIEEMKEMTLKYSPGYRLSVEEDIIRIVPGQFN